MDAKDVLRDEQIVDLWRANFAHCTADTMRFARALEEAILAAAEPVIRADERERILAVARDRAAHEASAAAHHAGNWHPAHEHHLKRHAAMQDVIGAIRSLGAGSKGDTDVHVR